MTVPFYSQAELDAAIAKERLWIRDLCLAHKLQFETIAKLPAAPRQMNAAQACEELAEIIETGNYPRPSSVAPRRT